VSGIKIILATSLLLIGGCFFDSSGLQVSADGADDLSVDGVTTIDGVVPVEGGQIVDAPGDVPTTGDGPITDTTVHVDGPKPPKDLLSDTVAPCPATCAIACLPGSSSCPKPSNVNPGQLPAPCGALTLPKGSTWRLCSNTTSSCRLVSGTDCTVQPVCAGKATNQPTTVAGATIPACVFVLPALTVEIGATLQVRGESPAMLIVRGTAKIAGTIDASAPGRFGGAGGGDGGKVASNGKGASGSGPVAGSGGSTCDCKTNEDNYDDCGGGGGGFATLGGSGGLEGGKFCSSGPQPQGGVTYGGKSLVPLLGGSGGGAGDVGNAAGATPGNGGGGGGVIQISAFSIDLSGAVLANGGPGTGGSSNSNTYPGGGGGGGSGGGILLEAVGIKGSGWTLVAGGGGGGGGDNCSASNGKQDKLVGGVEQAPTGGGGCQSGGKGGNGAYGAPSAAGNGQSTGIWQGPGGGGGGSGHLRFNRVVASAACPPTGLKTSGAVSCGTMSVQSP
jgi:hypothetical protein